MADREYERDDAGKFASIGAGGKRLEKNFRAAVKKFVEAKKKKPPKEAEKEPAVGRKTKGPNGEVAFYSFGDDPKEEQLGAWDLGSTPDDPTGTKNPIGSHIENIATGFLPGKSDASPADIAAHITEKLKLNELKAPPGHEIVYRLASKSDGLARKNAGNLRGIIEHAADSADRGVLYGTKLTAYAVKLPKTFQSYEYLRQQGKQ